MGETVEVPLAWFERAVQRACELGCPFCGSQRPFYWKVSEEFTTTIGCLDCNRWFNKPRCTR